MPTDTSPKAPPVPAEDEPPLQYYRRPKRGETLPPDPIYKGLPVLGCEKINATQVRFWCRHCRWNHNVSFDERDLERGLSLRGAVMRCHVRNGPYENQYYVDFRVHRP